MKLYRGTRTDFDLVVTVNGELLDPGPSQKLRNHSPDGFNWSYAGSGPAQLALAILFDVTGDAEIALSNYQDFKRQFVEHFEDEWALTEDDIRHWLSLSQTKAG